MLAPNELLLLLRHPDVKAGLDESFEKFCLAYPDAKEIDAENFFTLALLSPSIAMALANGYISFFEELSLERKAKSLNKHGEMTNMGKSIKFLITHFDDWENEMYQLLHLVFNAYTLRNDKLTAIWKDETYLTGDLETDFLTAPYALVQLLNFLFLEDEEEMLNRRIISDLEFEKIKAVGEIVGLSNFPIFQSFVNSYDVREQTSTNDESPIEAA